MAITDNGGHDKPAMVGLPTMISAPSTAFAESKLLSLGCTVVLAATLLTTQAQAQQLPTGGQVVAGQGSIASTSTTMTVTQNTANMAVNWQSFSIGQGNTVNFVQPSASAVALNRVLGSDVSVIQGALNANGKIFLINPNGVLFTPTAQVNVGSLVASTLNISTDDFMAGNYRFEGASSNAITNQGNITAANDGTVALIAAKIINTGQIDTPQGNVLMAAGNKVTLDMGGPVKIQVEKGALEALIEQGGGVRADGGLVYLTAKAAGELATAVINHTGITEARTLTTGEKGEIILLGDMAQGETIVGGRLDASAPNGGDGGFIETSAAEVSYMDGFLVTAGSAYGQGGLWLIDPADAAIDQTIADGYVTTLNTGTSVLNEVTGNITLNNGVSIAKTAGGDATLTFKATGNVILDYNSSITSTSGALNTILWADSDATNGGYININDTTIKSNGGDISFVGGVGGTGYAEGTSTQTASPPHQDGISIASSTVDSRVYIAGTPQTSGGGTITLRGKGYAGNLVNHGGGLWAGFGSIYTGGGNLVMDVQAQENTGATEVGIRYGAYLDGMTISTNGGDVQISTASPSAIWTGFHSNSSLNAGAGDITLSTDQISLSGTFSGTGTLSVQPITSGTTIGLAGGAGTLNINATEWGYFQNGFSSITIGNSTSGAITVGGSVTSNDDLNLINNSTIAINGALTVNNNLTMTSGGAITQTQALDVNETTTITAGPGNNVTLNNAGNDFSGAVTVVSGNDVSLRDSNALVLAASTISGDLTLVSGGNITQSDSLSVTGTTSITANDITLTDASNDFTGAVSMIAGNNVSLRDSNAIVLAASTISGDLTLVSGGNITQTDALSVTGTTSITTGSSNDITLINNSNDFTGAVSIVSGNNVSLIDSNAMTLGAVNAIGTVDIATLTGDLTLTGAVSTTNATSSAMKLNAGKSTAAGTSSGGNIVVSGGSVSVGAGGTAQLYSGSLSGSTNLATLVGAGSGRFRYNADETTDFSAGSWTALGTGLYVIYREQPTVTITASDDTKTYDSAAYSGGNGYTGSGFVNGDTIASITGTPAYGGTAQGATNAGTYTLSLSGLGNGLGYALSYTDGTLTINKAALTISSANVTKTYDGTTSAAGSATVTAGTLFGSDTISGGTFAFDNKNAGSNKTVAVSGVTVSDGNSGNNYTVSYADNTTSTINKAALTISSADVTKTYDGTTSAAGSATVTAGTLFGSDAISGGTFAFNDKNAGSNKTVTVSGVTVSDGNSGNNYTVSYTDNTTSTINKAMLTVTADDQTRPYGAPNPTFTQTISGFVNGENAITAGITGSAVGSSTATASSAAGAYVITGSTGSLAAGNYNFMAADGTLMITATSSAQQSAVQAAQMLPPTGALPLSISGGLEFVDVPAGTSGSTAPLVAQLPEGGTQALADMVRIFVKDGGILYERDKRQ